MPQHSSRAVTDDALRALPVRRACGTRHARGVYAESVVTTPLAACLFDPPLTAAEVGEANWYQPHRTPLMFERDGVTHFVVWVGAEYYPSVHDFIEEVRAAGASRKLPPNFSFERVTEASRMFFVHPRARVTLTNAGGDVLFGRAMRPATLAAALFDAPATERDDEGGDIFRRLPCGHAYAVQDPPDGARVAAEPGIFMQLGITGLALVNDRGAFPEQVEARVRRARVPVFRTDR